MAKYKVRIKVAVPGDTMQYQYPVKAKDENKAWNKGVKRALKKERVPPRDVIGVRVKAKKNR